MALLLFMVDDVFVFRFFPLLYEYALLFVSFDLASLAGRLFDCIAFIFLLKLFSFPIFFSLPLRLLVAFHTIDYLLLLVVRQSAL